MKKSQSSDYFNRLEKTLDIDKDGNVTFAKNLLADGTIGGNSGLKSLHEYNFISGQKLIILDERPSIADSGFVGFGYVDDNLGTVYPTLFNYMLENNKVTSFYGVANGLIIQLENNQLVTHDIAIQQ